mmetsp:Transcript_31376/g.76545  ORF Transcript_31376/g.76545 Transcript_31376/m.76545 type:complete len:319 (+) Transcript_31376:120-1076(+)
MNTRVIDDVEGRKQCGEEGNAEEEEREVETTDGKNDNVLASRLKASLALRVATKDDINALARIQVRAWKAAYKGIIADDYLAHSKHLTEAYKRGKWKAILSDKTCVTLILYERSPKGNIPEKANSGDTDACGGDDGGGNKSCGPRLDHHRNLCPRPRHHHHCERGILGYTTVGVASNHTVKRIQPVVDKIAWRLQKEKWQQRQQQRNNHGRCYHRDTLWKTNHQRHNAQERQGPEKTLQQKKHPREQQEEERFSNPQKDAKPEEKLSSNIGGVEAETLLHVTGEMRTLYLNIEAPRRCGLGSFLFRGGYKALERALGA